MQWVHTGDIKPENGAAYVRNPEIDEGGDFSAEIIECIPETNVGGDEKRHLLRQGTVFLPRKSFKDALATVGARIDGDYIVRPGHHGPDERFAADSAEGLLELFHAAHAYGSVEAEIEAVVQIGADQDYDQDRKFTGERCIFYHGSALESIIEQVMDGFDYPHGKPKARLLEVEEALEEGMSP
ncbi:hypothetical protein [Leisingera caerulea]|uniref:hypothetical protein n=1 Tax=Leisingera caerulea TaxID=506591 RepID=UPI0004871627|nr:hypothetical protein [Leisingera caerulea]